MTVDYRSLLQRAASTIAGHADVLVRGEGVSHWIGRRTHGRPDTRRVGAGVTGVREPTMIGRR